LNRFIRGIVCAVMGAALWGFSGACAQFLFGHAQIDPLFLTTVRMLGAGMIFLVLLLVAYLPTLKDMLSDRHARLRLLVFGCVGLFSCQITYVVVIAYTNAGTATVLQSLNIVIVMLATCVLERRRPRAGELAGLVMALAATVLVATKGDITTLVIPVAGLAWGLANALSVAFYVMYPKTMFQRWGSVPVTGLGLLAGGMASCLAWLCRGLLAPDGSTALVPALDSTAVLVLATIVVVGTFLAFGLYLHGVSIVGGMTGSLLGAVEPVSATACSAAWLGTVFGWADLVGLALMVATIVVVSLQGTKTAEEGRVSEK
jgi:drug/metabolite transporter (DMT)-like permease